MIIAAHLRHAAPLHPAGAEWTINDAFLWLHARGHDVRILSEQPVPPEPDAIAKHWQEADVMLTQLEATPTAMLLAATYQTPLVHMIHSPNQLDALGVMPDCSALVTFNAKHVQQANDWWPGPSIILHPPINADRVRVPQPGACATLVNLSASKGGARLWKLAEAIPSVPFLGVQGAYDHQLIGPEGLALGPYETSATGLPANLQVLGPQPDIRAALAYTRVLLVLSHSETYGRIAAEAAISGIPTIAFDHPGLREAIGPAGVYLDPDDPAGLIARIRMAYTDDWQVWHQVTLEQAHANARRQERELRAFEKRLLAIRKEQPVMSL